jgi:hypothetical protein
MKKILMFLVYAVAMLFLGFSLESCSKPESVNPVTHNTTVVNPPIVHSMSADTATGKHWTADTSTLKYYTDPIMSYNVHIHGSSDSGTLDLFLDKNHLSTSGNTVGELNVKVYQLNSVLAAYNPNDYATWVDSHGVLYRSDSGDPRNSLTISSQTSNSGGGTVTGTYILTLNSSTGNVIHINGSFSVPIRI